MKKEQDFTNREISHFLDEMKNLIVTGLQEQNKTLSRIESQVIKTNGRVTILEYWKESITGKMLGATLVISLMWAAFLKFF